MKRIITVGRQFGSGGRELGRRLAEELGVEYYDKEIVTEISKKTSLSEGYIRSVVECRPHQLYPITIGKSIAFVGDYQFSQVQAVYRAQDNIIKELASKSDCVIVGRCADYILRELHPYRIFVYADLQSRIRRCMERAPEGECFTEKAMKQRINEMDKGRAKYYDFYTGQKWGAKENYDLLINTTDVDIKTLISGIARMFKE